ncbi:class E sortase [Streptomyces sp. AK02-01A]|uniref:class E sortase n=1 Tax=Streptomyces sp. AK02-01A TaxID=3028648 RepID=UPI0029AFBD72|nr:class E sortase [Streptomyces sp. AK02-01A]MDX3850421.1 class E sortase [Streptomyces sp. AK02-01A]
MTALRPEHDAGHGASYEQGAYGDADAFEAAVDGLADPLNDPLPGQRQEPLRAPRHRAPREEPWPGAAAVPTEVPAAGPEAGPAPVQEAAAEPQWTGEHYQQQEQHAAQAPQGPQRAPGAQREWQDPETYSADVRSATAGPAPISTDVPAAASEPDLPLDDRTVALRMAEVHRAVDSVTGTGADAEESEPRTGGRAERRKAARGGRGRKRPGSMPAGAEQGSAQSPAPTRTLSRVEARRAARALKESPAVIASRAVGELFISFGVLMLLFVTYQLWWTNVRADQYAGQETNKIQDGWAKGRQPGAFEPGQGFAIMHIPKLDVVVPIAEGISKAKVLDHGMVGHYGEGSLKTAMPSDKEGNFAVAGHRNTHGEPFRYINRLKPGDEIIVETQDAYYTYDMTSILPQTAPSNVSVIRPVPPGSGFTAPGRYITLTTCTPEFTSTYRMIVWGKMVEERPRSKGKPDALVG